ncbi:hypothetical protein GJV78_22155 [Escherichia alba]|uniref:Uncharacterized protein n=2 Tax=Intestinirhabdus alba TaxID=2899544 RepID=A0A6L6IT20_9ENTR|nr:hypothetical protein [Intestinirhabdus alba]
MGIDFSKSSLKDGTLAFIDIDNGLAFSAEKDNELDNFIKIKTGDFYQPRQKKGDLASVNMVMYDCMAFYHSKELAVFLKQLIRKAEADL